MAKFGKFTKEAASAQRDQAQSMNATMYMKLTVGRNIVRFFPPAVGEETPFLIVSRHFLHLPGVDQPVVFACPRVHAGKACPACQKMNQLRASGNEKDHNLSRAFAPQFAAFANVINRKNPDDGPKVLSVSKTTYDTIMAFRDEEMGGDFTDLEEGFDVIIDRTGTGKEDTKYKAFLARKNSAIGTDKQIAAWSEALHDLKQFVAIRPYDKLVSQLKGELDDGGADDDDIVDKPPAGTKRLAPKAEEKTKKKPPASIDDDLDDLDDDDDL